MQLMAVVALALLGFCAVEVLFVPEAGSPKFHSSTGQRADVFAKLMELLLVQEYVKDALLGGASPITMSSMAKPS